MKLCILTTLCAFTVVGGPLDSAWIKGTTDKNPLEYKTGEEMIFTFMPMDVGVDLPKGEYFMEWTRSGDDCVKENGKFPLEIGKPFVYRTKTDKPGFVRLFAHVVDKDGKLYNKVFTGDASTPEGREAMNRFERMPKQVFCDAGAAANIKELESHPEPKDFDEFWAKQYARLDKIPLTAKRKVIENPVKGDKYRMEAVEIACCGLRPVTGFMMTPPDASKTKQYPVFLQVFGYDGNINQHRPPLGSYWEGKIVLEINAHGMPLEEFGSTEVERKQLWWYAGHKGGRTYAFNTKENEDPELAYFNGMVLRVKRALQFLKTLPEWNGRDIIVAGGSQGGLQTIWAAGCGEGVTEARSCIPWCADMYTNSQRNNGQMASSGWYIPWTEAMGYYDAANFAKRIPKTCFTFVTRAGLGDYICPPTGVYKLWKNIPGNKRILWVQGSQHGYVPPEYPDRDTTWEEK